MFIIIYWLVFVQAEKKTYFKANFPHIIIYTVARPTCRRGAAVEDKHCISTEWRDDSCVKVFQITEGQLKKRQQWQQRLRVAKPSVTHLIAM